MEADISIWRKTGHFYFALTCNVNMQREHVCQASLEMSPSLPH